ncbi:MAG: zinc-binding dehydrogenase [Candidatus Rokuibacteriota bacterium]
MHRDAFVEIIQLAAQGRLKPVVGKSFRMSEVAQAHAYVAGRGATGKTLLVP